MKRLVTLLVCLLCAVRGQAQTITLHGSPQGVTRCTVPAVYTPITIGTGLCPAISAQVHWKPGSGGTLPPAGTLVADLAHTHIQCNIPQGGEVATGTLTVPCQLVLFHTAGRVGQMWGALVSAIQFDRPSETFPVLGDPAAVITVPFHLTIDTAIVTELAPIPDRGPFSVRVSARTGYDNADQFDTQFNWTLYSIRDPSAVEPPVSEGGPFNLQAKAAGFSARDTTNGATFGAHLVEFMDLCVPIYAPFRTPVRCDNKSYSYGPDHALPPGDYHLICGNDYHAGLPGTDLTFASSLIAGGSLNHDVFDPVRIAAIPPIPGYPVGHQRCTITWDVSTDPVHPITAANAPGTIAPGQTLVALLSFDVAIGPNPVGCTPEMCAGTDPPPVVVLPPPAPIPTLSTIKMCAVETFSDGSVKNRCLDLP